MLRRLTNHDFEDAPDAGYIDATQDAVNKLVDHVSTQDKPKSISFLKQADVELFQIDIQVPDPWHALTLAGAWVNNAGLTAAWMKHYDGSIELKGDPKSGGVATTIFTLPAAARPQENRIIGGDDGAGAHSAFAIDHATGIATSLTAGANGMSLACRYMAADPTPMPLSCFPISIKTKLKSVAGITVQRVEDAGSASSASQASAGWACSVDFTTTTGKDNIQIKIRNIAGLPYNRKSRVTLLAIGGP